MILKKKDYQVVRTMLLKVTRVHVLFQVLAATQTPGEAGKKWFQGTADAVRQFHWLFEVLSYSD